MNSYPHEFLAHPQPLMFVGGLLPPTTRNRALSTVTAESSSRRGSATGDEPASGALSPPITSPAPKSRRGSELPDVSATPPSEPISTNQTTVTGTDSKIEPSPDSATGSLPSIAVAEPNKKDEEFEELVRNLRGALESKSGKGKVWLPEAERKDFKIMLVDKAVRLPARKVNPSAQASPDITARSPLSPMIPTSPMYPDGLIAPLWIRKHVELVPSVFVLFLRLYESTGEDGDLDSRAREAKEREMDDLLVKEIGERRRRLGERGIKLTVVLMASAETLDSPVLDPRLSYLRRASALSSKASLFVLTPVPAEELPDFVQSLQDALYESAMEYYGAHAKRVRRKRARLPPTSTAIPASKALSPGGWGVRYDFKAAWFAEVRGEFEIARRHYEDCWNELARLFTSTQLLPPRTKRWAEAKVLADCVAVRICRLLLYDDEAPKVLNPFFVHLKRFGDFSRGWGIGEDTFEFWSWIARQYRIFAELLELGMQDDLRIPHLAPPVFPTAPSAALPPSPEYLITPISSTNPLQVLQQPAFYFYTAAICSLQRQTRFEEALSLEEDALASEAGSASGYVSSAPGFAAEKKVDHAALVVELFTKAYSLLKEQDLSHGRIALFVAYRIAETYCRSGQYEMAMRFFDRISHTFKREKWSPIVREIRDLWYECVQRTGNVEMAARILLERMSPASGVEGDERASLPDDFMSLINTTSPTSTDPIVLEMDDSEGLLSASTAFWKPSAHLSEHASFQVALRCPDNVDISSLPFSALTIAFSDDRPDILIKHDKSAEGGRIIKAGRLGTQDDGAPVESMANLSWKSRDVLVVQGELSSNVEAEVQIASVRLDLQSGSWNMQLVFALELSTEWYTETSSFVPLESLSSHILFEPKPHLVSLDVKHHPSAFVDEDVEITVTAKNDDARDMVIHISVFLHPNDEPDESRISIDSEESDSLLKDTPLGTIQAGTTTSKVIRLRSPVAGNKIMDISLQSTLTNDDSRMEESDRTVVIPILPPFMASSAVRYRQVSNARDNEAFVATTITCPGPRVLHVDSLSLEASNVDEAVKVSDSLTGVDVPTDWDQSTALAVMSRWTIHPPRRPSLAQTTATTPGHFVLVWKSDSSGKTNTTRLPIPPLILPPQESFILATIDSPTTASLDQTFIITLHIRNLHPSQPFVDLHLQVETAEAFVWVGSRLAKLPAVPAGGKITVKLEAVPVGGVGWFNLPNIRLWQGEGEGRSEISLKQKQQGGDSKGAIFVKP